MRLALFEPDIPQNTGTLMRLCACLNVPLDIIEPCGFVLSDKNLKRAGMDYLDQLDLVCHADWNSFKAVTTTARYVLMTTKTNVLFTDFEFKANDILIAGRESMGVPDYIRQDCSSQVTIPMASTARSLNVAVATALIMGEALRQTKQYPIKKA